MEALTRQSSLFLCIVCKIGNISEAKPKSVYISFIIRIDYHYNFIYQMYKNTKIILLNPFYFQTIIYSKQGLKLIQVL